MISRYVKTVLHLRRPEPIIIQTSGVAEQALEDVIIAEPYEVDGEIDARYYDEDGVEASINVPSSTFVLFA